MKVLITGVDGFIGRNLVQSLLQSKGHSSFQTISITGTYRNPDHLNKINGIGRCLDLIEFAKKVNLQENTKLNFKQLDLLDIKQWDLHGFDVLIHGAGLAHRDFSADAKIRNLYQLVNTKASVALAKKAKKSGVKQFIFLSTSKVLQAAQSQTHDPYSQSKYEAEIGIQQICTELDSSMACSILRLPLVYGVSVGGNFASLWRAVERFPVLPTGSIHSKRSLIGVRNLSDFIEHIMLNEDSYNQILIPTDSEVLSLSELIAEVALAQNKKIHQLKTPTQLVIPALKLFRKEKLIARLYEEFILKMELGGLKWQPPHSLKANLQQINQG